MQTLSIDNLKTESVSQPQSNVLPKWIQKIITVSEANRLGVVAALVLLQISVAGLTVVIPPMAGASVWLMAPGIFMAFISNSLAFAQMKMEWVLLGFGISILVNAAISLYYFIDLFN